GGDEGCRLPVPPHGLEILVDCSARCSGQSCAMKYQLRSTALVLALVTMTGFAARADAQASKCTSAKLKAVGKEAACKLNVYAKAASKNVPVDSTKLADCEAKFSSAFTKAEAKNDCLAPVGDVAAIETKVDGFVTDVDTDLAPASTTTTTTTSSP